MAGLTCAFWLDRYGFEVVVVERASGLRPGGQALDVRGPALEVAARMGVLDALRSRNTDLRGMSVVDEHGVEVFRTTERTLTGGRLASADVEILRDDLIEVLQTALGDRALFRFADSVASLGQDDKGVHVVYASGAEDRFDVVVGADGSHSGVRRLVFGSEKPLRRYMGDYVAVMTIPNFTGLDRWQTFHMGDGGGAGLIGVAKDQDARAYLGFSSAEEIEYDHHDTDAQKQLLAEHLAGTGWVTPQIIEHMWASSSFYFDARSQVVMPHWTRGRVALVGDAGYAVSLTTGQGTSIAMVGAYVLAGELANAGDDLGAGAQRAEDMLRAYVLDNQAAAQRLNTENTNDENANDENDDDAGSGALAEVPDFGELVEEFELDDYADFAR